MESRNGLSGQADGMLSEINMTPLVDVMLVLLIIFMLTVPVLTRAVRLDLPQATAPAATPAPDAITLSVTRSGDVYWDQQLLNQTQLAERLRQLARQQPQREVRLRGDRHAEYQHVLAVLALAQQSGVTRLGFVTEVPRP